MEPPPTQYAVADDGVLLGYQTFGSGAVTALGVTNWSTNLELLWTSRGYTSLLERLSEVMRIVVFDHRGTGASEGRLAVNDLDRQVSDMVSVLDAAGVESTAVWTSDMGTPAALALAATHPERVSALVLMGATARLLQAEDYAVGFPSDQVDPLVTVLVGGWGNPESDYAHLALPGAAGAGERADVARIQRLAVSPSQREEVVRGWFALDGRRFCRQVAAPTLLVHRSGDALVPVRFARWIAEQIPGARLLELPGAEHFFFAGDRNAVAEAFEEFLLGDVRPDPEAAELAAVVITDIVDSTGHAVRGAEVGWREVLDRHDAAMRALIHRYGGKEAANPGDSFVVLFGSAHRALAFAAASRDAAFRLSLALRCGVHVGDVATRGERPHGLAIHIASRVQALAEPGEILVSDAVRAAVAGSTHAFADRGEHDLRGVPERWRLAALAAQ